MNTRKVTATGLMLGALGVVFGDIGTSPLYAMQAIFGIAGQQVAINRVNVLGVISLVLWAVTIVVSIKYVGFLMRADNKGEGGIVALVSLLKSSGLSKRAKAPLVFLGLIGIALFYGDSAITPAISVLAATEGLEVITPGLGRFIIPVTLVILTGLFWVQKYGTGIIGKLFGPVMLLWFTTIGLAGLAQVFEHPEVLAALSPLAALRFMAAEPVVAFVAMGAVVLAITGAEALYADMGHFGRKPISRAWFWVVFPALALCYMGQGALLLHESVPTTSAFYALFPAALHIPAVILATMATLIASQSVIAGAFSLTRQAMQLNFLPKMLVSYTSRWSAGQIYVPFVNLLLFVAVTCLVLFFGSSQALANAFGVAVSGTLAADTILFLAVMLVLWRRPWAVVLATAALFVPVDILFVSSNSMKVFSGGWVPVAIGAVILLIMCTWQQGQQVVARKRKAMEGSLQAFILEVQAKAGELMRVPGQAVYIGHHPGYTPLALRSLVEDAHELHEKAVIVFVEISSHAHVPLEQRAVFDNLGYIDGISQLCLTYGFHDTPNIPKDIAALRHLSPELDFDPKQASYFISLTKVMPRRGQHFAYWRKVLYALLVRNALSRSNYYRLPLERTVEVQTPIQF